MSADQGPSSTLLPVADRRATLAALGRLLRPRRRLLALAAVLFVGRAAVGLVGPAVLGRIVDLVRAGDAASAITGPAVLLAVAAVAEGLFAWAGPAVGAQAAEPALADLREEVVDRALEVPAGEVERAGTGDLVARVDGDVAAVADAVKQAFPQVLEAGLTIALTAVGVASIDWRLGLAALCALPIQLHTLRWYLPRSSPLYASEREAAGGRSQQLLETIGSASTIRSLGLAEQHHRLLAGRSQRAVDLVNAATRLRTRFFARLNLAELTGLAMVLGTGFFLVRGGSVSVGGVTAAALYFQRLFDPFNILLYLVDEAQAAGAALARLVGVSDRPAAVAPTGAGTDASVQVDQVRFAYDAGHEVLHGLDLAVAPGERIAVVGTSGAGKTTLAKLVAGIHPPGSGTVAIGSVPVDAVGSVAGRVPVVLLSQESHVFAGPLADDLRLAAPHAGDDDLLAALRVVGAEGWALALPEGLATVVGDGGHRLTGVQAQQLALARVVLVDPAVVVLDEATAEGGSAGARSLEASAEAALAGRTAVVVAHRLTQAVHAGRVVVVDRGAVAEAGTHAELAAAGGAYARLWDAWSDQRERGAGGAGAV
ncbi:ABC transporter ATP-binding protein/permease [Aquihabitans sp. G128]|uniref:ABC transporter ATP-binding protein n=1 Tax=Aquihabitans sp. G128 TaxID=2849779 RepID=UPI001C214107|nr:ABC transporter ATP-binding protein [Aquihabitans sp. G128]QXC63330.1 ABC transporter ATP-binding protein/permease [Aquihabitans sp. G128]